MARRPNYTIRPPLLLREKVNFPLRVLIWAPIQLTINLIRGIITAMIRRLPIRPYMTCAVIRMFLYVFSPRQLQFLFPPTVQTYRAWIRGTRSRAHSEGDSDLVGQLKEDIEVLPDGTSHILWIGDRKNATKFVYFFHGGGYIVPASSGHMEWCLQAYVLANRSAGTSSTISKDRVAVAVLQYTLAPLARFPTQMCQAASGLAHLLRSGIRPSQLIVGGDSAGGNLTAQLLGHLLHPYPAAESITLKEPMAGAFLVSPLVSGNTSTRSFVDGLPCDMLSVGILNNPHREMFHQQPSELMGNLFPQWNTAWAETKEFREGKGWALMADVDEKWVDRMGQVVRKVYVTCGRHEIMRDQGIYVAETIRTRNPDVNVKLEVAEKEAHDFILIEGGERLVGDATTRMRAWFSEVWS